LTIDKEIDLTENKDSDSSEGIEIKEKDLHDLTIPAVITVTEAEEEEDKESDISVPDIKENILADPAAQRAYIKDISNAIPEFNGQKIHLQRFITALMLVYLTKGTFEDMAVEVIKSKIIGFTLYKVQNETTINSIIMKLLDTIVGETSDVVKAKMAKTSQKGKTAEKFTSEIDSLQKLLEADKFSTKEAITTMFKNCEHGRLKQF